MTNEEAILRVLTEIRDAQREDLAYRRKIMEQSIRMQRSSFWLQDCLADRRVSCAVRRYIA